MKPLIIGQAPSKTGEGCEPINGRSGKKLAACMGVSVEEYLERFERVNVLDRFPGKQGKGDKFPLPEAREAAQGIRLEGRPFVLLLGRGVASAFGLGNLPWLEWAEVEQARVAVVPHPSGINRWWNEQENRERAREFLGNLTGGERSCEG